MLTQRPLVQTPGLSAHSFTSAGGRGGSQGLGPAPATLEVPSSPPRPCGPGPPGQGGRLRLGNGGQAEPTQGEAPGRGP